MICSFILNSTTAFANNVTVQNQIYNFTQTKIQEIKEYFGNDCSWNSNTVISRFYVIKATSGIPYSYIIELKNDQQNVGHIELSADFNEVYGFSFQDISSLTAMLKYRGYEPDIFSGVNGQNIYFAGSLDYAILVNNKMISLSTNNSVSIQEFVNRETIYFDNIEADHFQVTPEVNAGILLAMDSDSVYLTQNQLDTLGIVIMNDFQYSNHCAPTAGVNFIRYLYRIKGKNALWPGSNLALFNSLYDKMDTTSSGTYFLMNVYDDAYTGLKNYASSRNCPPASSSLKWHPTFAQVKTQISNGHKLMFCLSNYLQTGGYHTVFCAGYAYDAVQIIDGWTRGALFKTYSRLVVVDYYYIDY